MWNAVKRSQLSLLPCAAIETESFKHTLRPHAYIARDSCIDNAVTYLYHGIYKLQTISIAINYVLYIRDYTCSVQYFV